MTNTVTVQQTCLLQQLGDPHPNPRKQFITNLIKQIQDWRHTGKEILLGMDANKDVNNPRSQIM